ncbi:MAG: UDP-N-acetylglucosamine 1-carboxyvinyltransferase [Chthoniobacterales bacterium]|nr:UDP-N-acetylglucosamine 1-carboxyvinyltransferase [Chthoniobacterales bacterium]
MDKILVHGGRRLEGEVRIGGSKNSALPILAATLLTKEKCVIDRVPDLSDIHYMLTILSSLGAEVERASGVVQICAEKIITQAPYEIVRKMRASVCVLGPLLGREKSAKVSLPGGCVIGDRPIDLHLKWFEALGAKVTVKGGDIMLHAEKLKGARINLRGRHGPTVLGTGNIMMAAVLAEGTTVIEGAAEEPEVVDLAHFLSAMGARISGAGSHHIEIEGVAELHGANHTVIPDRIEAGTFLVAGAIAGSRVTITRSEPNHLGAVIHALKEAGFDLTHTSDTVTISPNGSRKPLHLETIPYPGFPTDMQAQFCAMLATMKGTSVVSETVFPQRFMHIAELKRMGANIDLADHRATIHGVERLSGAPVMASDLRASAALVLAALPADGVTEINRVYHIDRGYEAIDEKLNGLGAHIERVKA